MVEVFVIGSVVAYRHVINVAVHRSIDFYVTRNCELEDVGSQRNLIPIPAVALLGDYNVVQILGCVVYAEGNEFPFTPVLAHGG